MRIGFLPTYSRLGGCLRSGPTHVPEGAKAGIGGLGPNSLRYTYRIRPGLTLWGTPVAVQQKRMRKSPYLARMGAKRIDGSGRVRFSRLRERRYRRLNPAEGNPFLLKAQILAYAVVSQIVVKSSFRIVQVV